MTKTIIIGGGISGWSFAYYLTQKKPKSQIVLLEEKPSFGGWLKTIDVGGYSFTKGPKFFARHKSKHLYQLMQDVGLQDDIIYASVAAKKRYVYQNQAMHLFPTSLYQAALSPLTKKTIFPLVKEYFRAPGGFVQESAAGFIERRFRSKEISALFATVIKGIYAVSPERLSVKTAFPQMYDFEKRYGSIIKALLKAPKEEKGLFTLREGPYSLIEALQKKTPITCRTNCKVHSVAGNTLHTSQGIVEGDHIVLAAPLHEVKRLYPHPFWKKIPTHTMHIVHMGFLEKVLPYDGYGYLTHAQENTPILGGTFDSRMYPRNSGTSGEKISFFIGENPGSALEDQELFSLAENALTSHVKITKKPVAKALIRGDDAGVIYGPNHEEIVDKIIKNAPSNLTFLGNYIDGVSVDSSVKRAKLEAFKTL